MATKRKNCSGVKGFNCGQTCISRKYACRIELSGQSIQIASAITKTIQSISNLFPDPNSLGSLPPMPKGKSFEPYKRKPAKSQPKLPELDLDNVRPLNKSKSPAEQATEIARQLRNSGYNGKTVVKGSTVMLPGNGIIEVGKDGFIETYNLSKRIQPFIDILRRNNS